MASESHLPPLAERVRPTDLREFLGQDHLIGDGTFLQKTVAAGKLFSSILWGPPGTGKTTLAKLIAKNSDADFHQLSAVSSGVKELRKIIESAKENTLLKRGTLLFIDEIHRFNKAQQDGLLHAVEDGTLALIGATTENPSFEVISPLLSRCRVLKLNSLSEDDLTAILENALSKDILLSRRSVTFEEGTRDSLVQSSGGDARKMLNTLEAAVTMSGEDGEAVTVDSQLLSEALQSKSHIYDKAGDYHYDTISAFIKSVRGSDPDAAVRRSSGACYRQRRFPGGPRHRHAGGGPHAGTGDNLSRRGAEIQRQLPRRERGDEEGARRGNLAGPASFKERTDQTDGIVRLRQGLHLSSRSTGTFY